MKISFLHAGSYCTLAINQTQEMGDYYTRQPTIPVKPTSKEDCYSSYPISLTRSETALKCFQETIKARHLESVKRIKLYLWLSASPWKKETTFLGILLIFFFF